MPKISIIVPVYNVEEYIHRCIDSILAQTFTDFELILVDDGSPDKSGEICEEYAKKDKRIRVIHKENGGQGTARNMALDVANAKYIGFVDGDDFIASDMFEELYNAIVFNNAQISVCGRYNVSNSKTIPFFTTDKPIMMDSKEAIRRLLIYDNIDSSSCDKLFDISLFDNMRFPSGYICEDVAVVYKLIDEASKIVHTGKPLYYYIQRQNSTSRSSFTKKTMGLVIYHKQASEYVKGKYPDFVDEANYFYLSRLIYATALCLDTNDDRNSVYKDELMSRLKDKFCMIINNKYITKRDKIKVVSILFNCYYQLKSIYKLLRMGKNY